MADIIKYTSQQLRVFSQKVSDKYKANLSSMLVFDDWKQKAFTRLFNESGAKDKYPMEVRIAPTTDEMLKILVDNTDRFEAVENIEDPNQRAIEKAKLLREVLQPKEVFTIEKPVVDERTNTPIWFGDTKKYIKAYLGYENGDSTKPFAILLGDPEPGVSTVHAKICGGTGSGKTVSMHTLINNLLLYNPPWELNLMLVDLKKNEFPKYVSPVMCPGIEVVGATDNTQYVTSVLDAFADELNKRQSLFSQIGVEKIEDFRNKYNMVMPRVLLIADEFPQLKQNLKTAEQMGSTNTADEQQNINTDLFKIATLGRSQGMHMIPSGQSLVGQFEETTGKQFSGGLALKVDSADDSTDVIGNPDSAFLRGKGKGIVNLNRGAKDSSDNKLIQIPYIDNDLSDEDRIAGKQTYLTETILMLSKLASQLNIKADIGFYSDTQKDSITRFFDGLDVCYERFENSPYTGSTELDMINKEVYKANTLLSMYFGKQVKYSKDDAFYLDLERQQKNNIIVSGDVREYGLSIIADNIRYYNQKGMGIENYIVNGDLATFKLSGIEDKLRESGKVVVLPELKIPLKIYNRIKGRNNLLAVSNRIKVYHQEKGMSEYTISMQRFGTWETKVFIDMEYEKLGNKFASEYGITHTVAKEISETLEEVILNPSLSESNTLKELLISTGKVADTVNEVFVNNLIIAISNTMRAYKKVTQFKKYVDVVDLPPIFIWLIGAESLEEVIDNDMDVIRTFNQLSMIGPKVNVVTIMTSKNWSKARRIADSFNIIIEKENKSFFSELGVPARINITEGTYQIHDVERKKCSLVKQFKLK